jgi:hypothetical protein
MLLPYHSVSRTAVAARAASFLGRLVLVDLVIVDVV